jgi:hypothetical protein
VVVVVVAEDWSQIHLRGCSIASGLASSSPFLFSLPVVCKVGTWVPAECFVSQLEGGKRGSYVYLEKGLGLLHAAKSIPR